MWKPRCTISVQMTQSFGEKARVLLKLSLGMLGGKSHVQGILGDTGRQFLFCFPKPKTSNPRWTCMSFWHQRTKQFSQLSIQKSRERNPSPTECPKICPSIKVTIFVFFHSKIFGQPTRVPVFSSSTSARRAQGISTLNKDSESHK